MKITHTVKVDKLTVLDTQLKELSGRAVKVGALTGDNAWLAGIHEYGCNITVTPRMRAYLHSQGLHLKDSTTVIKIPERSFLRSGHDENAERVLDQTSRVIKQVLIGKMSVDDVLDLYGQQMATAIKIYMRDLSNPANHPYTIEKKGSSNPLVDSGGLIESIVWKID